jgi:hypothetical protein
MTGLISEQFRMPRCGVNEEPFMGFGLGEGGDFQHKSRHDEPMFD